MGMRKWLGKVPLEHGSPSPLRLFFFAQSAKAEEKSSGGVLLSQQNTEKPNFGTVSFRGEETGGGCNCQMTDITSEGGAQNCSRNADACHGARMYGSTVWEKGQGQEKGEHMWSD